jgi:hypothetical protein
MHTLLFTTSMYTFKGQPHKKRLLFIIPLFTQLAVKNTDISVPCLFQITLV